MNESEVLEVTQFRTLTDSDTGSKILMSVPMTQSVTEEERKSLDGKPNIALKCSSLSDAVLAVIEEPTFFENRKEEIISRVFGTFSLQHPKAQRMFCQGKYNVTGKRMRFLKEVHYDDGMDHYRLTPAQIEEQCKAKGADAVFAF